MFESYNRYLLAADAILLVHAAFVGFVVLGFAYIWAGYFAGWRSAGNTSFRIAHLLAMAVVLCESLLRMICPLTEWENALRIKGGEAGMYETGFVREWVHRLIFFDLGAGTFLVAYVLFFALIVLTFRLVPPAWPGRPKPSGPR